MAQPSNVRPFEPRKRGEQPPEPPDQPPPAADAQGCPIKAYGHAGGEYWFATRKGELLSFTYRNLFSKGALAALFDGDIGRGSWVWEKFPRMDKSGDLQVGITVDACASYLVRACVAAGMIDPAMPQRGCGVWRDPDGVLVHCGDAIGALHPDGGTQWLDPGFRRRGAIYRATVPVERPARAPAAPDVASDLRDAVACWNWRQPAAPDLVIGWIGAALLGAAPAWRAHFLVTGARGSGKSWLLQLVAAALGPMGVAANGFSEAGLRQALSSEARALLLDEAEDDQAGRVQRAIELLRLMSSGAGARVLRGSSGGQAQRFDVAGAAWLSAINPPQLQPQDASRITRVDLDELGRDADPDIATRAIAAAAAGAPALWARMLAGFDRFGASFARWRAGLVRHGCDARQAEQPATLLAAWWTLTSDEAITDDVVAGELESRRFDAWIRTAEADADESGAALCWSWLCSAQLDVWKGGERWTIGQLLNAARDPIAVDSRRSLETYGIKVEHEAGATRVLVANRNQGLSKIFAGSAWRDGKWVDELRRLPGAQAWDPVWFAGAKSRATRIPAELLAPKPAAEDG